MRNTDGEWSFGPDDGDVLADRFASLGARGLVGADVMGSQSVGKSKENGWPDDGAHAFIQTAIRRAFEVLDEARE